MDAFERDVGKRCTLRRHSSHSYSKLIARQQNVYDNSRSYFHMLLSGTNWCHNKHGNNEERLHFESSLPERFYVQFIRHILPRKAAVSSINHAFMRLRYIHPVSEFIVCLSNTVRLSVLLVGWRSVCLCLSVVWVSCDVFHSKIWL